MNDDRQAELFEALEPPRGGLAGLHARLAREEGRRERTLRVRWAVAGCAAVLAFIAVTPLLHPNPTEDPLVAELQLARMRLGIERPPIETLTIPVAERNRIAAERVPLGTDRVIFYRIGFTTSE